MRQHYGTRAEVEMRALASIPASLGKAVMKGSEVTFEIYSAPDLRLTTKVAFEVSLSDKYPLRPPSVRGELPGRLDILDESSHSGWSRSYDLAVLFYALRRLFLKEPHWDWFPEVPGRPKSHVLQDSFRPTRRYALMAGEASTRGRRREMEDVTKIDLDFRLGAVTAGLVCLFDGHGGRGCAQWAGDHVPHLIQAQAARSDNLKEVLWRAFVESDRQWHETGSRVASGLPDASGCTALTVLFDGASSVYVANLGDCRCVLGRRGHNDTVEAHDLSFDARADRPDEIARVCAARGFVANRRVNGQLAVSRALGDLAYKHYVAGRNTGPVASTPDVTHVRLEPTDQFLVVACDGLWDVLSSQAAVDYVASALRDATADLTSICQRLVRYAVDDRKSTDNVSVCIVKIHAQHSSFVAAAATPQRKQTYQHVLPEQDPCTGGPTTTRPRRASPFAARGGLLSARRQLPFTAHPRKMLTDHDDDILSYLLDDRNFKK